MNRSQLIYTSVQRITNLPNDEYRAHAVNRKSFSWLKSQGSGKSGYVQKTPGMLLGSMVHDILSGDYTGDVGERFEAAKAMAVSIKQSHIWPLWDQLESEVSYLADLHHHGLVLPTMGRTDKELRGKFILDFKITSAPSDIGFMRLSEWAHYDDQQWHYAKMAGVQTAYILPYSTKTKACLSLVRVPLLDYNRFWAKAVDDFGIVTTQAI